MHCREKIFGIGSGFHETWTMKHSRGTTGSRAHPGLLIIQVGVGGAGEVGVGGKLYWEWLGCAQLFQFSTKRQRQFSLHFPVYVRGVGPADGTRAICLRSQEDERTFFLAPQFQEQSHFALLRSLCLCFSWFSFSFEKLEELKKKTLKLWQCHSCNTSN